MTEATHGSNIEKKISGDVSQPLELPQCCWEAPAGDALSLRS